MAIGKEGNVKWVDGLRGFASTLVVLTHICRAFDGDLFLPTSKEDVPPRLLQWPYIRILVQGRIGVTIFAFVTGYVCALKPIKLCRQGQQEAALTAIGKSALRRVPRLVLPAAAATTIAWLLGLFGVFNASHHTDSWWIGFSAPEQIPYLGEAITFLINTLVRTWTRGENKIDGNQWTMLPLLKCSIWAYVFLSATSFVKPRYRMMLSMAMWMYFYFVGDAAFGMQTFWGIFLADLQNYPAANQWLVDRSRLSRLLCVVCIFIGLTLASYPENHPEWMAWSKALHAVLEPILPKKPDFPRFASGLGLQFITLGLHFSPSVREIMSNRWFIWLGKQSFAVYLLHGSLIRSVLVWMIYGMRVPAAVRNDRGEMHIPPLHYPGGARLLMVLPFWIPLNYAAAVLWTTHVDPWAARVTERLVGYVQLEKNEKGQQVLPA